MNEMEWNGMERVGRSVGHFHLGSLFFCIPPSPHTR